MRYFFNVRTIDTVLIDDEGCEFQDINETCKYALEVAAELAREYPRQPKYRSTIVPLAVEVMDQSGAMVFRTPIQ
jgi:hypothetical protein